MKKRIKHIGSALLACALLFAFAFVSYGYAQDTRGAEVVVAGLTRNLAPQGASSTQGAAQLAPATPYVTELAPLSREEVIYGNLSATGSVEGLYAVMALETNEAGALRDFGAFSSVTNLTDTATIDRIYDGVPVEADTASDSIAVSTESQRFTYQGDLVSTSLPWTFAFNYTLDGVATTPAELAGASGAVGITINTQIAADAPSTFVDHYMLQITATLDAATTSNIVSETASVVNAGGSRVVNFTILPGSSSSNSFTVDATNFEMAAVQITAIPFSMAFDMPDTSELTSGFQYLQDAITLLDEGAQQLNTSGGSLTEGSASLVEGSAVIKQALELMASSMSASDLAQLQALPTQLRQLANGLDYLVQSSGVPDAPSQSVQDYFAAHQADPAVQEMYAGYMSAITMKTYLVQSSAALNGAATTIEQLTQLYQGVGALSANYGQFHSGVESFSSGLGAYSDGVSAYAHGVSTLNVAMEDMPAQVQEQIEAFMNDYTGGDFSPVSFVSAENQNTTSCSFVLQTAAIEIPEPPAASVELEAEKTFLERLLELFGL